MGHAPGDIRQTAGIIKSYQKESPKENTDFVLEKVIFNNVFGKDIRRVFIYKKAERLARAIHLITPAFSASASLGSRLDGIAVGLVEGAMQGNNSAREKLFQELLLLSSVLSIARTSGLLSSMNADLIAREAHALLGEVASYEEPRLSLDEAPTLSGIAKSTNKPIRTPMPARPRKYKGHIKDTSIPQPDTVKDRREGILSIIRTKKQVSIKDISTLIRGISEKTIQRELVALTLEGVIVKHGERRWSVYSLA